MSEIIKVRMKRGGRMPMEVSARVYRDSDGSGEHFTVVEDLEIYWLGGSKGKRYPVSDSLIVSSDEVGQDYLDTLRRR